MCKQAMQANYYRYVSMVGMLALVTRIHVIELAKISSVAIAMHVTIHRVRSQGVCPNPSMMPMKSARQQEMSRSLPEGQRSTLIEL